MASNCYQILRKRLCMLGILLVLTAQALSAASSTVQGKITDGDSKDALPGANVVVKGTSLGAATNLNGYYIIYNVPAGEQTLTVSYVGYRSVTVQVTVVENQDLTKDVALVSQAITGETVVVTAQAQGQMQAINQQLSSNSIVSIVSEAKIQELPDFNAAEAIGRLPGISVLRSSGEANKIVIRGMAPQYNLISVNDITLASTGKDDRSVDLTMISPYMLQSIDVHKSLTPDMEGNAIGGAVNMQLREAPPDFHSDLMWQSGYTAKNKVYGNYKALASASDRFLDDRLGLYFLLNAEQYDRGADNFNASYAVVHERQGAQIYAPVKTTNSTLNRHFETRKRYGGNLIVDYKLGDGTITMVNMFSRLGSDYRDHRSQFDYINKNLNFNYGDGSSKIDLGTSSLQGRYDFGSFSADLSGAFTYSRNFDPKKGNYQFTQGSGMIGDTPENTPPERLLNYITYKSDVNYLSQVGYDFADYKENDQTYAANFKIPFNLESIASGYLKFGGKYRHYDRRNDENTPYAQLRFQGNDLVRVLRAQGFSFLDFDGGAQSFRGIPFTNGDPGLITNFLGDKYGTLIWAPQISGLDYMTDWILANASDNIRYYSGQFRTKINDYSYDEKYYATYAMSELNIGPDLMIVGGVRYEEDDADINAYYVKQDGNWLAEKAQPQNVTPKNHFWLPMVQSRYNITDWADVRYAYTQTIARPNFTQITPYENLDQNGQGVNAGNPNLKPARAYNHDLMFTFHNNDIGLLSIGGFYKTIYDFSYFIQYALLRSNVIPGYDTLAQHPGAQSGANLSTFYNNPYKAFVKGVEVDFQTRFWYLPFPLDGLVLGINYTHIKSETTYPLLNIKTIPPVPPQRVPTTVLVDSSRSGRLVFQPDDILNLSLGYDYEGFSGRASFFFQGNMVSGIGARSEQDGFTKDYFRWDIALRQKLPWEGLQLFLDINNINQRTDISAQQSIGGSTSEQYYGLTADLGVRFTY